MVFFDVTKRESHQNVARWVSEVRKVTGDIPIVVVGNKIDLPRIVKAQEGSLLMRKLKVQYYDLSVKTRFNLEMPLLCLARRLLHDNSLKLVAEEGQLPRTPSAPSSRQRRGGCLRLRFGGKPFAGVEAEAAAEAMDRHGVPLTCRWPRWSHVFAFSGRSGSKVSKRCSAAVAAKPVEQAKEVAQRKLLAEEPCQEVEVLEVIQHPRKPELALVEVTDPDFPEGPPLPVAAEAERWKVGDKAALMQVGSQVPKAAPVQGLLRQLAGAALARSRGAMEGPLDLAKLPSVGLLFPVGACEEPQPLEAFQSRVALEVAFAGADFRGSLGSEDSVEAAVRNALLQVGVVPPMQKPPFQRLSRTDAGVHARSFRLVAPLLRIQATDLRRDGTCPGLCDALNRRLPEGLRCLEVARLPFLGNLPAACVAREYRYYLPRSLLGPGGGDFDAVVEQRFNAALNLCVGRRGWDLHLATEAFVNIE
ncbi:unnamed protein product [Effrenium voratum]|nr:unnamed protein product [Effrenium voratum]